MSQMDLKSIGIRCIQVPNRLKGLSNPPQPSENWNGVDLVVPDNVETS